jgi:hypothetical protein
VRNSTRVGSIFAIFIFLYCCTWFAASQWVYNQTIIFLSKTHDERIKFNYTTLERGGFPFSLDWHLLQPTISVIFLNKEIRGKADRTTLSISPFSRNTVTLDNQAPIVVLINKEKQLKLQMGSESNTLMVNISPHDVLKIDYDFKNFRIDRRIPNGKNKNWKQVSLTKSFFGTLNFPKTIKKEFLNNLYLFSFEMNDVSLAGKNLLSIETLNKASGSIQVKGNLGNFSLEDLVTWRDKGGVLNLETLRMQWRLYELVIKGALALDEELKPIGAGTIDFNGIDYFLADQVKTGKLNKSEAKVAKLAIRLLTQPKELLDKSMVRIPITAQNGKLKAGPFSLIDLPGLIR